MPSQSPINGSTKQSTNARAIRAGRSHHGHARQNDAGADAVEACRGAATVALSELSMDVSKAAEVRNALRGGTIYIERMRTLDDNGREIQVQDGMIHHWYGAMFVPSIALDPLLRWLQDYDHHSRYFKNVEQSKLLSGNGDTFNIFLRLTRSKIVTVHYNTEHTACLSKEWPWPRIQPQFHDKDR